MLKLICVIKFSNIHMHPQIHSQDSLYFTLTLAVLRSAALLHLKRGTTAVRHCRTWAMALPWLKWPLGARGIYTLPLPSQRYFASSSSLQHAQNRAGALSLSLPPLLTSSPQANLLISPSILEGKGFKNRLESSSIDSPTLKSTWLTFWPAIVFVILGAWLLSS